MGERGEHDAGRRTNHSKNRKADITARLFPRSGPPGTSNASGSFWDIVGKFATGLCWIFGAGLWLGIDCSFIGCAYRSLQVLPILNALFDW